MTVGTEFVPSEATYTHFCTQYGTRVKLVLICSSFASSILFVVFSAMETSVLLVQLPSYWQLAVKKVAALS